MLNACRKTVTSLALAGDGRFLATGECGHMPNVRVWDISDPYNAVQFAEFSGHKYGINCVVSSKRGKPATCSQKSITIDYARIVKTKPEKLRSGECSERIDESFFLLIDRLINHICISFAISLTVSASAYSIVNQILSLTLSLPASTILRQKLRRTSLETFVSLIDTSGLAVQAACRSLESASRAKKIKRLIRGYVLFRREEFNFEGLCRAAFVRVYLGANRRFPREITFRKQRNQLFESYCDEHRKYRDECSPRRKGRRRVERAFTNSRLYLCYVTARMLIKIHGFYLGTRLPKTPFQAASVAVRSPLTQLRVVADI